MKFFEYLDRIYITKNQELSVNFTLKKQALTRAIPDLINWQRSWFKFLSYFTLVFGYVKCSWTGIYPEMPSLSNQQPTTPQQKPKLVTEEVNASEPKQ